MMYFELFQQPPTAPFLPHFFVRFQILSFVYLLLCFHSSVYIFGCVGFSLYCICPKIYGGICVIHIFQLISCNRIRWSGPKVLRGSFTPEWYSE